MVTKRKSSTELWGIVNGLLAAQGAFQSGELSAAAGITRQATHRHLRDWVAKGRIVQVGQGRGARYLSAAAGSSNEVTLSFGLPGLDEDEAWKQLVSQLTPRSEAKRLMASLERFEEVELDFHGVNLVGQGFADEVFRVWTRTHPGTRVTPVRMSPEIEPMIRGAMVRR
jgi:hypothetical protein